MGTVHETDEGGAVNAGGGRPAVAGHASTLALRAAAEPVVELIKLVRARYARCRDRRERAGAGSEARRRLRARHGRQTRKHVVGLWRKAPAAWAAFVNGSLGHMLDYDDVGAGGHVSIATVPAAFAIAEKLSGVKRPRFDRGDRRGHRHSYAPEPRRHAARLDDYRRLVSDADVRVHFGRRDAGKLLQLDERADGECPRRGF